MTGARVIASVSEAIQTFRRRLSDRNGALPSTS